MIDLESDLVDIEDQKKFEAEDLQIGDFEGTAGQSVGAEPFMKSELSPEAPVYVPPPLRDVTNAKSASQAKAGAGAKEPQCSRYSRRSVRQVSSAPNSPRPILGTKLSFPRPILGRRSEGEKDEADEYIGKEFRSMTRSFSKMKLRDENQPSGSKDGTSL
ncbi:hypothetical protein NQ318_006834 [Aromia moschata]|uniref:Uncharacterized protein n=1 Tax=Aromia moschata TaxID=1265417 RepID=A0AAV8XPU3_9CUCU|nr:hypothetical protein NQ318_006834 [Aromia moschata]